MPKGWAGLGTAPELDPNPNPHPNPNPYQVERLAAARQRRNHRVQLREQRRRRLLDRCGGRLALVDARALQRVEGLLGAELLGELRGRIDKTRHKITKRLLTGAEALAVLGSLDEEVATLQLDLKNAAPNESSDAAKVRAANLAECERLAEELAEVRRAEAQAELMQQIGR